MASLQSPGVEISVDGPCAEVLIEIFVLDDQVRQLTSCIFFVFVILDATTHAHCFLDSTSIGLFLANIVYP